MSNYRNDEVKSVNVYVTKFPVCELMQSKTIETKECE